MADRSPLAQTLNRLIEYLEARVDSNGRWEMSTSHHRQIANELNIAVATLKNYITVLVNAGVIAKGSRIERRPRGSHITLIIFVIKLPGARMEQAEGGLQIAKQE